MEASAGIPSTWSLEKHPARPGEIEVTFEFESTYGDSDSSYFTFRAIASTAQDLRELARQIDAMLNT